MFRKSLQILAVPLLVLGLFLVGSLALVSADPPDPPPANEMLEQFWQEAYGSNQLGAQQIYTYSLNASRAMLLAKAEPDECFYDIGEITNTLFTPPCPYTTTPKVNQAYVWGLTQEGDNLWFGTAANVHCLVIGGMLGAAVPGGLMSPSGSYVCEFGESAYSPPAPAAQGDWRPPDIFMYDTAIHTITEVTPPDALISETTGIRVAGNLDGVILVGGPQLTGTGINLFAFNAATHAYLGSTTVPTYSNIRKTVVVSDVMYLGVGHSSGGAVLRWRGTLADPFQFEEVGQMDGPAAELAVHNGRIFVSTWPNLRLGSPTYAGLYMSPVIPAGGLTAAHAASWTKVWDVSEYEPDPLTAYTYGGGALASFDGYLYWGTMHVPGLAARVHFNVYDPQLQQLGRLDNYPRDVEETAAGFLGTYRSISIFRGRNFGTATEETEVLYGMDTLPVPSIASDDTDVWVEWNMEPTKMGSPKWGTSGFGNFFNNYTWAMEVYRDHLYIGTMDWSYLVEDVLSRLVEEFLENILGGSIDLPPALSLTAGADLYRIHSSDSPAEIEDISGLGYDNGATNYGVRNMVADEEALYLGMANPMNLIIDTWSGENLGGWELIRLDDATDLSIEKNDLVDPVAPGQTFFYQIDIWHDNPDSDSLARDMVVTDTLGANMSFFTASPACNHQGGVITCTVKKLYPDYNTSLFVAVTAGNVVSGTTLTNTVAITALNPDVDLSDNEDVENTTVATTTDVADLRIWLVDPPDNPVLPGAVMTFQVAISNAGPEVATSTRTINLFPTELTVNSMQVDHPDNVLAACTAAGVCALGNVDLSAMVLITISATVPTASVQAGDVMTMTMAAISQAPDADMDDNMLHHQIRIGEMNYLPIIVKPSAN